MAGFQAITSDKGKIPLGVSRLANAMETYRLWLFVRYLAEKGISNEDLETWLDPFPKLKVNDGVFGARPLIEFMSWLELELGLFLTIDLDAGLWKLVAPLGKVDNTIKIVPEDCCPYGLTPEETTVLWTYYIKDQDTKSLESHPDVLASLLAKDYLLEREPTEGRLKYHVTGKAQILIHATLGSEFGRKDQTIFFETYEQDAKRKADLEWKRFLEEKQRKEKLAQEAQELEDATNRFFADFEKHPTTAFTHSPHVITHAFNHMRSKPLEQPLKRYESLLLLLETLMPILNEIEPAQANIPANQTLVVNVKEFWQDFQAIAETCSYTAIRPSLLARLLLIRHKQAVFDDAQIIEILMEVFKISNGGGIKSSLKDYFAASINERTSIFLERSLKCDKLPLDFRMQCIIQVYEEIRKRWKIPLGRGLADMTDNDGKLVRGWLIEHPENVAKCFQIIIQSHLLANNLDSARYIAEALLHLPNNEDLIVDYLKQSPPLDYGLLFDYAERFWNVQLLSHFAQKGTEKEQSYLISECKRFRPVDQNLLRKIAKYAPSDDILGQVFDAIKDIPRAAKDSSEKKWKTSYTKNPPRNKMIVEIIASKINKSTELRNRVLQYAMDNQLWDAAQILLDRSTNGDLPAFTFDELDRIHDILPLNETLYESFIFKITDPSLIEQLALKYLNFLVRHPAVPLQVLLKQRETLAKDPFYNREGGFISRLDARIAEVKQAMQAKKSGENN